MQVLVLRIGILQDVQRVIDGQDLDSPTLGVHDRKGQQGRVASVTGTV